VGRYVVGRLVQAGVTVAIVATVTFALIHLAPGDPFTQALDDPAVSAEVRALWRAKYGLDLPLYEQYWRYLLNVARGDLGWSVTLHEPVSAALARALPSSLLLMGTAILLSFAAGIALGVVQAARPGSWVDRALGTVSLFFHALPEFWLALMMLLVFAYRLPLFPVGNVVDPLLYDYYTPWQKLVDRLRHLVLPSATLALLLTAGVARFQRAALLEVSGEDFVRTARAKGLGERRVLLRHALRNALLPVITLFGVTVPALVAGAVFVEKVFAWPGMGLLAVSAIMTRDYWLVTACVVVVSAMVALGSLAADLLYAVADPRLRAR
jgi:peptide/nickel transport system permease protein